MNTPKVDNADFIIWQCILKAKGAQQINGNSGCTAKKYFSQHHGGRGPSFQFQHRIES